MVTEKIGAAIEESVRSISGVSAGKTVKRYRKKVRVGCSTERSSERTCVAFRDSPFERYIRGVHIGVQEANNKIEAFCLRHFRFLQRPARLCCNTLLPDRGERGPEIEDKRRTVNGILWVLRTGRPLADPGAAASDCGRRDHWKGDRTE